MARGSEEGRSSTAGVPSREVATLDSPSLSLSGSGTCSVDDEENAGGAPKVNALSFGEEGKDVVSASGVFGGGLPKLNPTGLPMLPGEPAFPNPPNGDGFAPMPIPVADAAPAEPKLNPVEVEPETGLLEVPNADAGPPKMLAPLDALSGLDSSSFEASDFPNRLLAKTEGDDEKEPNIKDVGPGLLPADDPPKENGDGFEDEEAAAEGGLSNENADFVGADVALLSATLEGVEAKVKKDGMRPGDESSLGTNPVPAVSVEDVVPGGGKPAKLAGGVGNDGAGCDPEKLDALASVEAMYLKEDPPKVKPNGGVGRDTARVVLEVLSFLRLSSYSVFAVTRNVLYRSNRSATSRNGSDSTALDTADRKDTFRPRKAVKYFVSTAISSSG